ncbi:MAG: DUF4988 domain-containing protein [Bacteroidales bacterium]|nr:DUF4988 domain-containing protein [Bacteroidales bacterium]
MKKISTIQALAAVLISLALAFVSCTDLSDLEKRVDSLDSRITALETQISGLNSNIEALSILAGGATINSVTESNGTYTIVLTNGETITLSQGSDGVGVAPKMSVDKEGYWMVDYNDGNGSIYLLNASGEKLKATGETGAIPVVGVDSEGYWTVDYGDGPQRVRDSDGNYVNALSEGEGGTSFFTDVVVGEGYMTVTMKNGDVLSIPVVPDFLCAILDTFGVQYFSYGQTKTYNVTMTGVESTMVTAPQGWRASLSESVLSVTAPAAETKAIADTRTDVSILAISKGGFAAITKLLVEAVAGDVEANPKAMVTAEEITTSSITFSVAVSDITAWYYLFKESAASQPDAAEIKADGTEGSEKTLVFDGLADGKGYTLYVLPVNEDKEGEIASATVKTVEKVYNTLYEKYEAGADITIGDKIYNKSTYGEAKLISSADDAELVQNNNSPVVFFVDPSVTALKSTDAATVKMVVIGNDPKVRSDVKLSQKIFLNVIDGIDEELVFYNMNFDANAIGDYTLTHNTDAVFSRVCFDNCKIQIFPSKPFAYISSASRSIENLIFVNSEIVYPSSINQVLFLNIPSSATYSNIIMRNNLIYCSNGNINDFRAFNGSNATIGNVVFEKNTMVNVTTATTFLFYAGNINSCTVSDNLVYATTLPNNIGIIRGAVTKPSSGSCEHNAYYVANSTSFTCQVFFGGYNTVTGLNPNEEFQKLSENPFNGGTFDLASGSFVPGGIYSSFGAQR